jgi:hypothetical protein
VGGVLTYEELGLFEVMGRFEITRVEKKIGNPMVSLGTLSVAMYRGPMFPKEGKVKGSPGQGVPPLVLP